MSERRRKELGLNFKRGILSMLHNTMKRFDLDHSGEEEDVRGTCRTDYRVVGVKETSLLIEKNKDLDSCRGRSKLHSVLQSTSVPFTQSPFSDRSAGASTVVVQKLILLDEGITEAIGDGVEISRRTPLTFDHALPSKSSEEELETSRDLIRQLCKRNGNDIQIDLSDLFSRFIHSLRLLTRATRCRRCMDTPGLRARPEGSICRTPCPTLTQLPP
ncbi:hypothetical protein NQ318_003524 [Aromia moschata]|uniref:Vitellogenin domain-containing protein n=1 Tax=Aromia moschata TaxID=1265417 RepID=A0AAV8YUV8_9CUCU|nr:hypothetical protein NQ318_003524 [Aromia moschata]